MTEPNAEYAPDWSAYDEPEFQRLCTQQIRDLSDLTVRQAQARVILALTLKRQRAES
jgi:hypothetical protein